MTKYDPARFLKCPQCFRTHTVSLTIHADGDATIECVACGATGFVHKLNESDRTYD